MNKILTVEKAIKKAREIKKSGQKIVLTGGCFDILHPGHLLLLKKSKAAGGVLFVLLESDEKIKENKGQERPLFHQKDRAEVISNISTVDYVVPLPFLHTDKEYDDLLLQLTPDIISTTKGDPYIAHKKRQAKMLNAKVKEVTDYIPSFSTSIILEHLRKEL